MQVFLIRHPAPRIAPGICYGQLDVDCEGAGAIAQRLRPRLPAGIPVYSSPLRRALNLARALSPEVRIDRRLAEIAFGEWEGRWWDDIERSQIDAWAADVPGFTPPGGESVAALHARALDFAATLDGGCAAIVTHAGVMRALLGHWRDLPLAEWSRLEFAFGEMIEIEVAR